ncbi:MAG: hypothetical protein RID91_16095 [Azospirillaceae bacterium]
MDATTERVFRAYVLGEALAETAAEAGAAAWARALDRVDAGATVERALRREQPSAAMVSAYWSLVEDLRQHHADLARALDVDPPLQTPDEQPVVRAARQVEQRVLRDGAAARQFAIGRARGAPRTEHARLAADANAGIAERVGLEGTLYYAVLDERTSAMCLGTAGKVWFLPGQPSERPPLHPSCRSILMPVGPDTFFGEPWYDAALARARRGEGALLPGEQLVEGERRENAADLWLRSRSAGFRETILGPARARLFDRGVRAAGMATRARPLRLSQIRTLNADAIRPAA